MAGTIKVAALLLAAALLCLPSTNGQGGRCAFDISNTTANSDVQACLLAYAPPIPPDGMDSKMCAERFADTMDCKTGMNPLTNGTIAVRGVDGVCFYIRNEEMVNPTDPTDVISGCPPEWLRSMGINVCVEEIMKRWNSLRNRPNLAKLEDDQFAVKCGTEPMNFTEPLTAPPTAPTASYGTPPGPVTSTSTGTPSTGSAGQTTTTTPAPTSAPTPAPASGAVGAAVLTPMLAMILAAMLITVGL